MKYKNQTKHPPCSKILLSLQLVPCIISHGLNTKLPSDSHCSVLLGGVDRKLNLFPLSYETYNNLIIMFLKCHIIGGVEMSGKLQSSQT